LIERARLAGIETLVLTVDTVVSPNREYNVRNGFEIPIKASLRGGLDMMRHPAWVWTVLLRYIRHEGIPTYQHYPPGFRQKITRKATSEQVGLSDSLTWDDLSALRRLWRGRLILKGVLRAADAVRAADLGVDAIVVTSHGARNLDGALPPLRALPAIAAAVKGRVAIIADSGVRRGSDILKLMAAGADAALIGRAALYGTAIGGEAGATHVLQLLRNEMETALSLLGCTSPQDLDASFVNTGPRT
jgi:L-lactate dehydrogenase (cytochrome)